MCARGTSTSPIEILQWLRRFLEARLDDEDPLDPRYNIAPSTPVLVGRVRDGRREAVQLRWGLVPRWAKEPSIGHRLINARAETLWNQPAFRDSARDRRCVIVFDGFYEWQTLDKGPRQPWFVHRRDGAAFAIAGLWDRWELGGEPLETCTVITTEPNDLIRPIHDRMPVILDDEGVAQWLDPSRRTVRELSPLLAPAPSAEWEAYPVSREVNRPENEGPTLTVRGEATA